MHLPRTSSRSRALSVPAAELKYIIFALAPDNKEIVVEKQSESTSYDDFINDLPAESCRYAVYDLVWEKPGEGTRSKICFYAWCVPRPVCLVLLCWPAKRRAARRVRELRLDHAR